ncbi:Adhesion G-protein coupled receptor D2 [Frankliniella fusca]|uniref:Adhesion G-protein coupled receptor D2 n=1 Tax=Frankliniella fusca TaxID=407009 RepID=A0AAE1GZG5_9NEOP|nr:Adhesion G-protein coupled receptor D2 [Frankliniella fusca]
MKMYILMLVRQQICKSFMGCFVKLCVDHAVEIIFIACYDVPLILSIPSRKETKVINQTFFFNVKEFLSSFLMWSRGSKQSHTYSVPVSVTLKMYFLFALKLFFFFPSNFQNYILNQSSVYCLPALLNCGTIAEIYFKHYLIFGLLYCVLYVMQKYIFTEQPVFCCYVIVYILKECKHWFVQSTNESSKYPPPSPPPSPPYYLKANFLFSAGRKFVTCNKVSCFVCGDFCHQSYSNLFYIFLCFLKYFEILIQIMTCLEYFLLHFNI